MPKNPQHLYNKRNQILKQERDDLIKKRQAKNLNHAYTRILDLVDNDSFAEIDQNIIHQCQNFDMNQKIIYGDGVITGFAKINERDIYLFSHDAVFLGGALGTAFAKKVCKVMELANQNGCPLIGLNESSGARIQEGVSSLAGYADIFYKNVKLSGVVPQISLILGPCAGGAVYSPALTDFVIMVNKQSYMFITGPDVVKSVTGETVSFEELGGALMHNQDSGVAHLIANSDEEAFNLCQTLLSYLPSNNLELPPFIEVGDEAIPESSNLLDEMIPNDPSKSYNMIEVIKAIVDFEELFEISGFFAPNIITAFARIGGNTVGIVANQPNYLAGVLDINASVKGARFIRFCDAFNIPILTFVDVPGYLPGTNQEKNGIIRHGAKLLYAYCEASVAKLTVITRKAYGGAFDVMGSKNVGADFNIAWPNAEIAVMGASGAVNILYRKELSNCKDPAILKDELIENYQNCFSNPYVAAEQGFVDTVIQPSSTRNLLINLLKLNQNKRIPLPNRKHDNIPL